MRILYKKLVKAEETCQIQMDFRVGTNLVLQTNYSSQHTAGIQWPQTRMDKGQLRLLHVSHRIRIHTSSHRIPRDLRPTIPSSLQFQLEDRGLDFSQKCRPEDRGRGAGFGTQSTEIRRPGPSSP